MSNTKEKAMHLKMLKARAFMNEASVLMENKFYATVVNRLYYACYHATKALLLTKDIVPKTHSGVVGMLHQHFVQPGEFETAHASFYSLLLQQRIEEDYSDFITENAETVSELIEPAKKYFFYIESKIAHFNSQEKD